MITAYASLETVKNALTHGAFEYLIKPFSRQDLEDVGARALARRQAELGTRSQLSRLVEEMRRLDRQDARARGGRAPRSREQSLRVTQLSILREISRSILGQLDLAELTTAVTAQLKEALGYDEVRCAWAPRRRARRRAAHRLPDPRRRKTAGLPGRRQPLRRAARSTRASASCSRCSPSTSPSPSATRGCTARSPRPSSSLEQLIGSAGDAIISIDPRRPDRRLESGRRAHFGLTARHAIGRPIAELLPEALRGPRGRAGGRGPVRDLRRHREAPGRPLAQAGRHAVGTARTRRQATRRAARHRARHHRAAGDRGPDAPVREAHRARPDRGRHRPRLQQPAAGDPRLRPAHGQNPGNVDVVERGARRDRERRPRAARRPSAASRSSRGSARDEPFVRDGHQPGRPATPSRSRGRAGRRTKIKGGVPLAARAGARPGAGRSWAGPAELNEVITNLILNAIDAMPQRRHAAHPHARPATTATSCITVADTGIGMTEEVRQRIFDPFFTTKGEEGTGLGLLGLLLDRASATAARCGWTAARARAPPSRSSCPSARSRRRGHPGEPPRHAPHAAASSLVDNDPRCSPSWARCSRTPGHHVLPVAERARGPRASSSRAASTSSSPTWAWPR